MLAYRLTPSFLCLVLFLFTCSQLQSDLVDERSMHPIPGAHLVRVGPNNYDLRESIATTLMLYAQATLPVNQCMAIFIDTYNKPEKAGFFYFLQAVETDPEKMVFKGNDTLGMLAGSDILQVSTERLSQAMPACSICSGNKPGHVTLGKLELRHEVSGFQTAYVFDKLFPDPTDFSSQFNAINQVLP